MGQYIWKILVTLNSQFRLVWDLQRTVQHLFVSLHLRGGKGDSLACLLLQFSSYSFPRPVQGMSNMSALISVIAEVLI